MHDESDLTAAVAEEARKRSPEERTAYLDGVCAARPELRDGVERLLKETGRTARADEVATAQFTPAEGQPAPDPYDATMMPPDTTIEEGSSVGPYKLLQELGAGGMGVVYMAEQQHPVRRKVALKIIKPGMDTREILARFEAERQALAMMDHPNIARVLDAGTTPTGCPYFVMELVKGVPITEYCDMEKLGTRDRLELFIDVCRAVQHAHQKGIIHRDLKPLNILVSMGDGRPVPKVIDFGVAKAIGSNLTEKTLFTRINQPVGTPAYMSPEQAEMTGLDIDTRSDVYALGVLLYELLTGTTPLEPKRLSTASFLEMQRMIREVEPPRPSTRLSTLGDARLTDLAARRKIQPTRLGYEIKGELDWVVMKALEKDRTRRYDTAAAFAQDVDNFLKGEMVLARPPSTAYRLSKLARRYKGWIATAAAMVILLIAGTVVSTWQAIRATRAEADALTQRDVAKKAEQEAIRAKDQAETVSDFLVDAFRSPDAEREGRDVTVAELIDRAVDDVATRFDDSPLTKASLLGALGTTYKSLGMPSEAISLLTEANAIWQANGMANESEVLKRLTTLASAFYDAGNLKRAKELYDSTRRKMQLRLRTEDVRTLHNARSMADILLAAGQTKSAIDLYQDVLQRQRTVLGPDELETLITEANLAFAFHRQRRLDEAIRGLEGVLAKLRKSPGTDHPRTLEIMNMLGYVSMQNDKIPKAIEILQETYRLRQAELGTTHYATLNTAGYLAQAYRREGQTAKAIAVHEETLQQLQDNLGPRHTRTLVAMNSLAVAYGQDGREQEGIQLLEEALKYMQSELPADYPETIYAKENLAYLYWITGAVDDALKLQQEVVQQFRRTRGEDDLNTLQASARLVEIYVAKRAFVEAAALAEDVLGQVGAGQEYGPIVATLRPAYAAALLGQEKFEDARQLAEQALATYQTTSDQDWYLAHLRSLLGRALLGLQKFSEAEPHLLAGFQQLQGVESQIPRDQPNMMQDAAAALASFYEQRKRPGDDEKAQKYRALAGADGE